MELSRKMVFIAQLRSPFTSVDCLTYTRTSELGNCNFYYPLELQPDEDEAKKAKKTLWT